ncbi:MAG: diguanylate cyclase [Clostridia bacterium]|nr:diguanylate cyclase [Clostridia bacterium]
MSFTEDIIINIYSIVLLIFISFQSLKDTERKFLQQRLFFTILQVTILMLVVDIFSRFDGNPGTIYSVINYIGNLLIFLLNPLIPSLWLLYAHFQVFHEEKKTKHLLYPLLAIVAINTIAVVLSQKYGWLYYIDSGNIYHRGPLFWFPVFITIALSVLSFFVIMANRKQIERKYFFSLLFFPVPPLACMVLQTIFYGTSLMLNGIAFSLFVVFINIQNRSMNTDYLTGAYNRKKLEVYMNEKINTCSAGRTFSAILIDFNDFKSINDTFGHNTGDHVLESSVTLLKSCLRTSDFIARFGGDEFYIILDVSDKEALEATVCRINSCIEKYNKQSKNPYQLNFSMGYAVYDYHSHMSVEKFQKYIDDLMYENKRALKEI